MRTFAGIAAACALVAGAAQAHPYTVEDLLSVESLGRVAFSPDGRWLVVERLGGWKTAPVFENDLYNSAMTSRLLVMDLKGAEGLRPLLESDPVGGDTFGPFSPSGARVIVYRWKDRRRELGVVTLATGAVAWAGFSVEPEYFNANARWRDEDEVIAIARDPASSPSLSYGWNAQVKLDEAWASARRGAFSGAVFGSGRFEALNPPYPANDLVAFSPSTGKVRALAHGPFNGLTVSPNGGTAAVISEEERTILPPDEPASTANPNRRRRLALVDLATGRQQSPCPTCDLYTRLPWRWSPDGKSLLALARTDGVSLGDYRYWRFNVAGVAEPLSKALRPGQISTMSGIETQPQGDVAWLGGDPLVLARDGAGPRLDWWRITARGAINLTATGPAPRGRALAKDDTGVLFGTADGLFRLNGHGTTLAAGAGAKLSINLPLKGEAPDAVLASFSSSGRLVSVSGDDGLGAKIEDGTDALALDSRGGWAVVARHHDNGVTDLSLRGPRGPDRPVLTLNPWLAQVATRPPIPIHHTGLRGEALTSWLYLPPDHKPSDHRPLIVSPYPGDIYPAPPSDRRPDSTRLDTSTPVLVGAGYAVLVPSLPLPMDQEPAPGLAEAILAAVDAAGAQQPGIATDRPAIWNSSFGGWAGLMAATQSKRFSAIIAAAPLTDFVAIHGEQNLAAIADPAVSFSAPASQAYTETGQARLNGLPWTALDRYIRNSPRYQTDKITAPVLILYGDLDFNPIQAMAVFTSLRRQGKDAELVIYRGESHIILGPDNVRDVYRRAFSFLAAAMGSAPEASRTAEILPSQ